MLGAYSLSTVIALQAIVLLAFVAEAAIGFGATVITVTLAVLFLPLDVVLPAFVPVNMLLSAYLAVRHHRAIAFRLLLRSIAPAVLLGLVIGIGLFRGQSSQALLLAFAIFVVVLSAVELWRAQSRATSTQPLSLPIRSLMLGLGGLVHGLFGTGGPMIVYALQREGLDKGAFRASLALVWLILNGALLVNFASLGLLGRGSAVLSLAIAIALVPALLLGSYLHHRLSARRFQLGIFSLLLIAGIALAARTATLLMRTP